jgi:hypothetical protein
MLYNTSHSWATGSWSPSLDYLEYMKAGSLGTALWDNYGGTSAWILLGEAKYETSGVPEPAIMVLLGFGLLGLAGTGIRRK